MFPFYLYSDWCNEILGVSWKRGSEQWNNFSDVVSYELFYIKEKKQFDDDDEKRSTYRVVRRCLSEIEIKTKEKI